MKQYLGLLQAILDNGYKTSDRTGTGTIALPGYSYQVRLEQNEDGVIHGFPLLTTKKVSLKSVFEELIWKLRGDTNIRFLIENGNHIWTEWAFKRWLQETGQQAIIDRMWKDSEKSDYSDEWKQKKSEFESLILADGVIRTATATERAADLYRSTSFAKKWGDLGRTYGFQFRDFGGKSINEVIEDFPQELQNRLHIGDIRHISSLFSGKDQLLEALRLIKEQPNSRRIIISLWNPQDVEKSLLPPCPAFYQFFANEEGMLHMNMYQRSCDSFLGVPYNTAQDALFLCLMAHVTGRKPGIFNHFFGDAHIYLNHLDQVKEQLQRTPGELPSIRLNPEVEDILAFEWSDIELLNYSPQDHIKGAVSI